MSDFSVKLAENFIGRVDCIWKTPRHGQRERPVFRAFGAVHGWHKLGRAEADAARCALSETAVCPTVSLSKAELPRVPAIRGKIENCAITDPSSLAQRLY